MGNETPTAAQVLKVYARFGAFGWILADATGRELNRSAMLFDSEERCLEDAFAYQIVSERFGQPIIVVHQSRPGEHLTPPAHLREQLRAKLGKWAGHDIAH